MRRGLEFIIIKRMRISIPWPTNSASDLSGAGSALQPWNNGPYSSLQIAEFGPPRGQKPRGGIVLIQEIFGLNAHIRADAALWAARGFRVWAPAYFELVARDASGRGPELEYRDRDFVVGRALAQTLGFDVAAKVTGQVIGELRERLRAADEPNQVMSLGYCWGGAVAFLSATRGEGHQRPDGFVSYYGRAVHDFRHETPKAPGLFHYGERDSLIPLSQVEAVREAQGTNSVFVYPAGHGFNRRGHLDHEAASAELALQRNLELWSRLQNASTAKLST